MTDFIIKRILKNNDTKAPETRKKAGFIGSLFGILLNALLFVIKFLVGTLIKSVSVIADAFNNLSDMGSSAVTLLGFKLGDRPADDKHPFGHGRIEYLSGLFVSVMIIVAGFELAKTSVEKIIHPEEAAFSLVPFLLLVLTIPVKLYLASFNKKLGKKVNSSAMEAAAADSRNDVLITTATLISTLAVKFTGIYAIDGYIGLLVALFVMWSGISIARETLSPLLGQVPDEELIDKISSVILSGENVCGIHDIIVHNYGPDRYFASAHAEIPADCDILKVHDEIDNLEHKIKTEMGVHITIHMDPVETNNEYVMSLKRKMSEIISGIDTELTFHDFRVVSGETHTNLIFDVVVPNKYKLSDEEIKEKIDKELEENLFTVIEFDRKFT
ncbi:MAG: cation transporter [Clostridia bacterium]|nr:cation transporter [Clostridia bacterium]